MNRRRRILSLLPILAIAAGAFGIGVFLSNALLQNRMRSGVAIAESAPPPPQIGSGCVQIAGPDGESLLHRGGKPLCVPFGSWENPSSYKQLTAAEVEQLSPEKRANVKKFSDGTFHLIEEPELLDYRYFIEKYDLPNPYDEQGNRKP